MQADPTPPPPSSGTAAAAESADVFDWQIEPITTDVTVARLRTRSDEPRNVITVNAATMRMASLDPALDAAVRASSLRVADGMGVVWSWRLLGRQLPERVAGIDLMSRLVETAAADGRSIFLLGARPDVVKALRTELTREHPELKIAGARDGYFTERETAAVVAEIRASNADVLFIGMPSPFKEVWADAHLEEFGVDLVLGVGGSFDVLAGFTPRAPRLMQRTGLEWAWRLICEPRRMWKRYLLTNGWLARQVASRLFARRRS